MGRRIKLNTTAARSTLMKRVRQKDTAPELAVRKYLHGRGLRFIVHPPYLPGRPDIVLPRRCTAIFVHGCFWHGHNCAHGVVRAKSNAAFWRQKLVANQRRDLDKAKALRDHGWYVETVWECQTREPRKLERLAHRLLNR